MVLKAIFREMELLRVSSDLWFGYLVKRSRLVFAVKTRAAKVKCALTYHFEHCLGEYKQFESPQLHMLCWTSIFWNFRQGTSNHTDLCQLTLDAEVYGRGDSLTWPLFPQPCSSLFLFLDRTHKPYATWSSIWHSHISAAAAIARRLLVKSTTYSMRWNPQTSSLVTMKDVMNKPTSGRASCSTNARPM